MFYRMAFKPLLHQLLIWISISTAHGYMAHLVSQVSAFIPDCAQDCVESFIELNFLSTACGASPSLQCLCSQHTQTGFTIGEGAVQCIVASDQLGYCRTGEVDATVVSKAYKMCSGQVSALPNTHPTLSATLVVPTSGTGIIIIETPTSTRTLVSATQSMSNSVSRTYSASPVSTAIVPTTFTTSRITSTQSAPPSPSSSSTTAAATATTDPQPTGASAPAPAKLATAQIVGISVGVAGAIGLALLAIFLARRVRRRQYPEFYDDGFFPMDEKRNSSSLGGVEAAAQRLSRIFHISPPILRNQQWQDTPPPPPSGSAGVDRSTIGLAISRPRSDIAPVQTPPPVAQRRLSKLLPPKPVRAVKPSLTLSIPIKSTLRPQSSQPPQTDRTSTMTNITAFADLDTEAAEGMQIWRPPPSDPQSATTYYVADRWGNWVLSNDYRQSQLAQVAEAAELDTYTPLTKSPIEKKEEAAAMAAAISAASARPDVSRPKPAMMPRNVADSSMSRTSSLYSQASAVRPGVKPLAALASRSNSAGRRKGRSDSNVSQDSATTIATSSTSAYDEDEYVGGEAERGRLSQAALSPVVESPRTPTGRSPVKYPKIPGRLDGATLRIVPPPKRPDFTASPPGQPSPTLGAVQPVRGSPSAYPPPLNPRRYSNLSTMDNMNRPKPPVQTSGSGFSPQPPSRPTLLKDMPAFPIPPLNPPKGRTSRDLSRNPPRLDTRQVPRPHIASFASPTSAATTSSVASSLLAKRRGSQKAVAMSLENSQKGQQWMRQGGRGADGLLSPDAAAMMSPRMIGGLPATPIWQPKLTPTRRGDDLFLNVQ
ncbi:uncharacterized protein BCR38DRAFT_138846 [Pseudomassariella vexata]|uniref:Extracellular membrane protein CFEM domain-containing protein n=1 Tax=Pseudomassariella vexata TaxID=1141098 RepID=A0A1Y2EBV9_9PEZI|nr:uncharacterized protein BCR38DRAFT_138846 [Pseudomassariella vexata]ORY68794.1 hypothetical protein BCR38DRAFT_138846 [Pseudomassariella vexata]